MNRSFIEVPMFTTKWRELGLTDEDLRELQKILLQDPKKGNAISGTGGLRKIRIPMGNREKGFQSGYKIFEGELTMSKFYEDTMQGLLEAAEIAKGNIPLTERKNMPAPTFYVADSDKELVDRIIEIRKKENISQAELAEMTENSQQAISRFEQKTHSPSLKLLFSIINALGYEIQLVKKASEKGWI